MLSSDALFIEYACMNDIHWTLSFFVEFWLNIGFCMVILKRFHDTFYMDLLLNFWFLDGK